MIVTSWTTDVEHETEKLFCGVGTLPGTENTVKQDLELWQLQSSPEGCCCGTYKIARVLKTQQKFQNDVP